MKALDIRYNRSTYLTFLALVVALFVVLASIADKPPGMGEFVLVMLGVPRLHDLGRSGWWAAAPIVIEIVGVAAFIGSGMSLEDMQIASGVLVFAILIGMIVLGLIPGQKEANQWGDPPEPGISWRARR